jgi:predicted ATPase/DNA-binding CsgD family transcriptional regulator
MADRPRPRPATAASSAWIEQLSALVAAAETEDDPARRSELIARVQRISGRALRASVGEARAAGVSWRELGRTLQVPFGTLHRQYAAGSDLQIVRPGDADRPPPPDPVRSADPGLPELPGGADAAVAGSPVPVPAELPAPLDTFVGRDEELSEVTRRLARCRLLTITGPAGAGKTRLALEAAGRMLRSYPDGVWLVELAPVGSGEVVPQTVAAALGVPERAGEPLVDTLAEALGSRRVLLVVDNCEHLIEPAANLLEGLLRRCPALRALTTSREPLQVAGEVVVRLGPLPVPAGDGPPDRAALLRSDAVRLFVDRARASMPGFELTAESGPAIAAICARLDGMPLAIELATRRLRTLPPDQLLTHLDDRFRLLAQPPRRPGDHQHSLLAAIEWSHELLTPVERTVFRRLAVLSGPFDLSAAVAVCATADLDPAQVIDAVAALETKSLLAAGADGRLRLLESIRLFARERLDASGEVAAAYDRLLGWLARLADPLISGLNVTLEVQRRLSAVQDNLQHAVEWATDRGDDRQVLLAVALAKCWRQHGYPTPGVALLERVLPHPTAPPAALALALGESSFLAKVRGDFATASRRAEQAVAIGRELDDRMVLARALQLLGMARRGLGNRADTLACYRERLELVRPTGIPEQVAICLNDVAWDSVQLGELEPAADAVTEALDLLKRCDEPDLTASVLHTKAGLALARNELDAAEGSAAAALRIPGIDDDSVAYCVEAIAVAAARRGQAERALRLIGAAEAVWTRVDMQAEPWWREQLDAARALAGQRLPAGRVEAALAWGRRLTTEQTVAYGRDEHWSPRAARPGVSLLSHREQQVTALVAEGLTNGQIARRLGMAERTVVSHLEHVRAKLDLTSRAQVAVWAAEHRPIPRDGLTAGAQVP